MGWAVGILGAAAAAWAWKTLTLRRYRVETYPDAVHYVHTQDGWRLALCRYRPKSRQRRHPVIICHGLGSSHGIFDLLPSLSLARFLRGRGFDVWLLDLRGHGFSERPYYPEGRRYDWCFDDYLLKDIPAAVAHVLAETGAEAHHWIGHSMGGLLLYARLAVTGGAGLCSGVALGSSLDYSASNSEFHGLMRAQKLANRIPAVPMGLLALYLAPLTGWFPNRAERFNVWHPNVDGAVLRRLMANGYSAVPGKLLHQLSSAMRSGGLRSADGKIRYLETLAAVRTPVLAVAGTEDRQCPPEAAAATLEAVGSTVKRLEVVGRSAGHAEDYGHSDLLIGRRAPDEVYPILARWLEEHDDSGAQALRT